MGVADRDLARQRGVRRCQRPRVFEAGNGILAIAEELAPLARPSIRWPIPPCWVLWSLAAMAKARKNANMYGQGSD